MAEKIKITDIKELTSLLDNDRNIMENIDVSNLLVNSSKMINWKCENGHTFKEKVSVIYRRKHKCFFCTGREVWPGENDLQTLYHIDKMTMAGGSAGHALAMIYAYRDGRDAPVPVVLTYGAVGPSSFVAEDWGIFGLGQDTDESRQAGAGLFSVMSGKEITPEEMADGSYREKVHPIAAAEWVENNPIPTVVAYGACDKMQPFLASLRLEAALKENGVDYRYFVLEHSGHGLQNDSAVSGQWMKAIDEYLAKYMPVE